MGKSIVTPRPRRHPQSRSSFMSHRSISFGGRRRHTQLQGAPPLLKPRNSTTPRPKSAQCPPGGQSVATLGTTSPDWPRCDVPVTITCHYVVVTGHEEVPEWYPKNRTSIQRHGRSAETDDQLGFTINQTSAIKIGSNMYEPVTTMIAPLNYQSVYSNSRGGGCGGGGGNKNHAHNIIDLVPPEKPPRKNKLSKLRRLQNNADGDDENSREVWNNNDMKDTIGGAGDPTADEETIDVEHINFDHRKTREISVQTSPLIPYRLRFWPRLSYGFKCDPEKGSAALRLGHCCRIASQWILSQMGLTLVVVAWALLGAYAFHRTEGPRETQQAEHLNAIQGELSVELATVLRQTEGHQETWPEYIDHYFQKHETLLLDAVSAGYGEGGGGSIWTYPGCVLFAVALLTTLGFGAPVPRTPWGRGTAVFFSAIGIPLHFLLILNMGNLGAIKLQRLAHRDSPEDSPRPRWLKLFPIASVVIYYVLGVALFGFVRQRPLVDCLMFPLDFTAAGGVALTSGHVRILYALYLEFAVTLAALVVSLLQASATRGIVDVGLRLGLLTNT